jgi:hypothetical protein
MLTAWTGVRPLTPDDHPILGPVPSVDGLVLNCGWGGTGIIQAPIAGQLVAEYITNGHSSTMDISPFGIERFGLRFGLKPSTLSASTERSAWKPQAEGSAQVAVGRRGAPLSRDFNRRLEEGL